MVSWSNYLAWGGQQTRSGNPNLFNAKQHMKRNINFLKCLFFFVLKVNYLSLELGVNEITKNASSLKRDIMCRTNEYMGKTGKERRYYLKVGMN